MPTDYDDVADLVEELNEISSGFSLTVEDIVDALDRLGLELVKGK